MLLRVYTVQRLIKKRDFIRNYNIQIAMQEANRSYLVQPQIEFHEIWIPFSVTKLETSHQIELPFYSSIRRIKPECNSS